MKVIREIGSYYRGIKDKLRFFRIDIYMLAVREKVLVRGKN